MASNILMHTITEVIQFRKKLYDYYVDYDILFGFAKSIDDKCDYYKKIEEKKPLYEYFEKECPPPKNNCPDFYNKCMPYKPDNVLSKLPCHEKIAKEQADAKVAERSHAMQHASASEQDTEVGPHGPGEPGLAPGSETEVTSDTSPIGTKVGQSVFGMAPILLTATALYRYTPIGSWIRGLGGNNPNNIGNMVGEEMEGFLANPQESGDTLFGDTGHYISYQSM
ncbi:PIR Superfamily Protein [Plasmodium ovale wallikeri]|uniref:PIR Superfamily Protein n=1 Tax=Plasmodium ovale wallikeri TaxID=864142 RepID=A0A1A9ALA4_PLAOA|nr:PIR Superfamily Protein [Plasmodium ovale wallikeri]